MKYVSLCPLCKEDFATDASFDAHKTGVHDYTFAEGLNMVPSREDGRRCLGVDEMELAGFRRNDHGRWVQPSGVEAKSLERIVL